MVKGALGVLGAAALLAIGCAQAFALDPVSSVPVPTVSVPAVTVPAVTVPAVTVPVPTVSVPVVTSSVPSVPGAPASSPSTTGSAPSAPSLPGSSTSSGSSGSSSGTGGSASGQESSSQGGSAGSTSSLGSSRPKAKGHRSGTLRRFESRPPKFRSRGKGPRGTTLVVWLSTDSLVGFSIVQIAPDCRRVGGFIRAGDQGKNRFRFSGRIDGRPLGAGTYRIRAAAVQGQETTSIRRETVVVVAPGQSVRSASAQKSTCGPGEEAAEDRAAIAAFAEVESGEPPSTGRSPVEAGSAWAQSAASGGQAGGGNGAVVAPESSAPPADFLLQPRAPNLAIASDVDAGWSPLALATVWAMFIVLLVIGGRELAERYRGWDAR